MSDATCSGRPAAKDPAREDGAAPVLVYAGRFAGGLEGVPVNCQVLSDWEVLPLRLAAAMEGATVLVVLDPLSFPFDVLGEEQWDVPMVVALPPDVEVETLIRLFDGPLFRKLGFFDRVAVSDRRVWERLRPRYGWGENQVVRLENGDPERALTGIHAKLFGPNRTALHDLRSDKAVHRAQARALGRRFAAFEAAEESGLRQDVLEVGAGMGRWAPSFDPAKSNYVGVDADEAAVETARCNFPERRFDLLGPDRSLPCEDESFDLVFSVAGLLRDSPEARRELVSEMWRVARPGAWLLFLETFVTGKRTEGSDVYPMSVLEFEDLLVGATGGNVVLEHTEALKYPRDDLFRDGVLSFAKLGASATL